MPHPVIDIGSNLNENLERWSTAVGGGAKLQVFEVIYSGKRSRWTARDISNRISPSISTKRVTECGKRLVGDGLVRQLPDDYPIVYEKISEVHHYKNKILSLARNKAKRLALPTKRGVRVSVTVRSNREKTGRAREITVDEIDQFSKVKKLKGPTSLLKPLPERRFKWALQKIFEDSGKYPDWGGERDDFYTNNLKMGGKRYGTAFALKGPGVGVKRMTPAKWGKNGTQIQRLLTAPGRVFILQFEGQIDEDSIDQLRKLTEHRAHQEHQELFYAYINRDDSLRLRRAYPEYF